MKPIYLDIVEKLGEPLWWDNYGVPRYTEFDPKLIFGMVSPRYIAFMEIACQECGKLFKVASVFDPFEHYLLYKQDDVKLPNQKDVGDFHYGDPPYHIEDCLAGYCESSIPVRILEFWVREGIDWVRKPEYEIEFEQEEEV